MFETKLPATFIQHAADVLADTNSGLSGPNIVKATVAYALEADVCLPHPTYPFDAPNKRSALYDNLTAFGPVEQYQIIKELCDHPSFTIGPGPAKEQRKKLKIMLVTRYKEFASECDPEEINKTLIEETRHWLSDHGGALNSYNSALQKYDGRVFLRNLIDDLRLSLELLLKDLFENGKSLENQISNLGAYIKQRGGSKELANMFVKLVEYYASYQNSYAKHNDAVIEEEIEFIFEITSSFMKHLVRLNSAS
jgi:hypothetical protein